MLQFRVLTAIIGIPVLIGLNYLGGLPLFFAVLITVLIGMDEIFRAIDRLGLHLIKGVGFLGAVTFVSTGYFLGETFLPKALVLFLFAAIICYVLSFPRVSLPELSVTLFSSIYVGYFFSFVFLLRHNDNGFFFLLLAFLLSWATDVGGYAAGRLWGKHKLAETLSPKKTREGALGGLILSVATAIVAFLISGISASLLEIAALGLAASFMGQIGDLTASAIKRQSGIKDFGNILPGHGGVLDRFDSFLLIAPLVYYYLSFFIFG